MYSIFHFDFCLNPFVEEGSGGFVTKVHPGGLELPDTILAILELDTKKKKNRRRKKTLHINKSWLYTYKKCKTKIMVHYQNDFFKDRLLHWSQKFKCSNISH